MNVRSAAVAGIAAASMGVGLGTVVASASTTRPMAATSIPVAYNWWRGPHEVRHYYGSIRPGIWGSSFGEPVSSLRWSYWGRHSAKGKGLVVHMGTYHVTFYLHDVKIAHGVRYFKKARETFANHGGTAYLHWSGHDWIGP